MLIPERKDDYCKKGLEETYEDSPPLSCSFGYSVWLLVSFLSSIEYETFEMGRESHAIVLIGERRRAHNQLIVSAFFKSCLPAESCASPLTIDNQLLSLIWSLPGMRCPFLSLSLSASAVLINLCYTSNSKHCNSDNVYKLYNNANIIRQYISIGYARTSQIRHSFTCELHVKIPQLAVSCLDNQTNDRRFWNDNFRNEKKKNWLSIRQGWNDLL